MRPWYGFDFDGTAVEYDGWQGVESVGLPVPKIIAKMKQYLAEGKDVRIVTARVFPIGINPEVAGFKSTIEYIKRHIEAEANKKVINSWSLKMFGKELTVQCWKDYGMIELWDDRVIQVEQNTGRRIDGKD